MNTDGDNSSINELTERIIGCAFQLHNSLGCGFLEKVYENALAHELRKNKFEVQQQESVKVRYDGVVVGDYIADLMVDRKVLIELKAIKRFDEIHMAQCINYLKATNLKVCLLLNFGPSKLQIKRISN